MFRKLFARKVVSSYPGLSFAPGWQGRRTEGPVLPVPTHRVALGGYDRQHPATRRKALAETLAQEAR